MKQLKKLALALAVGAVLATGISAGEEETAAIAVYTDGAAYEGEVRLVNRSAYVSLREFACAVDNSVVTWDYDTSTAYVETESLALSAEKGGDYMVANGRYLWCDEGIFTDNGVLYVPLRRLAEAFGFDVRWDGEENAAHLTRKKGAIASAEAYYSEEDVYWLSRIIHAEAQGEPFLGKLAVGNVVMNRVMDEQFPDDLYSVIFDHKNGVQFTPTVNGQIENTPGEDSVIAAKLCLDGYRQWDDILYFLNPTIATSLWVPQNCTFVISIGGHDFYA